MHFEEFSLSADSGQDWGVAAVSISCQSFQLFVLQKILKLLKLLSSDRTGNTAALQLVKVLSEEDAVDVSCTIFAQTTSTSKHLNPRKKEKKSLQSFLQLSAKTHKSKMGPTATGHYSTMLRSAGRPH